MLTRLARLHLLGVPVLPVPGRYMPALSVPPITSGSHDAQATVP